MTRLSIQVIHRNNKFVGDTSSKFRGFMEQGVKELVEMGEGRLFERFRPRPRGVFLSFTQAQRGKASTGNYRRNINGVANGLKGRIDDSRVVYGPWLEGTSSRNARTRFKGYRVWRNTRQWLEKQAPDVADRVVDRFIRWTGR